MNLQDAFIEIESGEFDARVNVVSGMGRFFKAARQEPAVIDLFRELGSSGSSCEDVLGRIHDLSNLSVDSRYENPKDSAIAILLWSLTYAQPDYAVLAAHYADRASQTWYTKKMAHALIEPIPNSSGDYRIDESDSNLENPATNETRDAKINLNLFATFGRAIEPRPSSASNSPMLTSEIEPVESSGAS